MLLCLLDFMYDELRESFQSNKKEESDVNFRHYKERRLLIKEDNHALLS